MSKITFHLNKLIRDGIPAMCEAAGITLELKTLTGPDFSTALKEKLLEEAREVQAATSGEETKEELADLLEVIYALCAQSGTSLAEIETMRIAKRNKRGGFDNGTFNATATMASNNPARKFYEK